MWMVGMEGMLCGPVVMVLDIEPALFADVCDVMAKTIRGK